jgi:hypothetical protein
MRAAHVLVGLWLSAASPLWADPVPVEALAAAARRAGTSVIVLAECGPGDGGPLLLDDLPGEHALRELAARSGCRIDAAAPGLRVVRQVVRLTVQGSNTWGRSLLELSAAYAGRSVLVAHEVQGGVRLTTQPWFGSLSREDLALPLVRIRDLPWDEALGRIALALEANVGVVGELVVVSPRPLYAGVVPEDAARRAHMVALCARLGAPELAAREQAEAELRAWGPVAAGALEAAVGHADPEVSARARALLEALRGVPADLDRLPPPTDWRARRGPGAGRLSLAAVDLPLRQLLDALEVAGGVRIESAYPPRGSLTVALREVRWDDALDAVARAHGWRIVPTAAGVALAEPPRLTARASGASLGTWARAVAPRGLELVVDPALAERRVHCDLARVSWRSALAAVVALHGGQLLERDGCLELRRLPRGDALE